MTYEIYRYIFMGGAILAGIMLVVSVLVFILLKIPTVIGDLTGVNARKAIENIRSQNENSGNKTYQTSAVNRERGKLTDKISPSGRLIRTPSGSLHGAMATTKLDTEELLQSARETTLLTEKAASINPETTVLVQEGQANETTVLNEQPVSNEFVIEYEITYIHTDEVIV